MANGYDNGFTEDVQYGDDAPVSDEREAPRVQSILRGGNQGGNTLQSASDDIRDAFSAPSGL
jgi:hypothetical protein